MATSNRKQLKFATLIQSDKPSASFKQSRKSLKLDFENIICVLELEPEDSGYKLLSSLTNNGKLSIISVISLSRSEFNEIKVIDNNATTLAFDSWEVSERFNIYSYFMHKRSENEDFELKDINPESFESFKWSPASDQMRRTREDISRPSSTKGQPNLSRSSIPPAHVRSTSSLSIEDSPPITDNNFLDSQLDSEPSPSINQLFHEMTGPSSIMNG